MCVLHILERQPHNYIKERKSSVVYIYYIWKKKFLKAILIICKVSFIYI